MSERVKRYFMGFFFLIIVIILMLISVYGVNKFGDSIAKNGDIVTKPHGGVER